MSKEPKTTVFINNIYTKAENTSMGLYYYYDENNNKVYDLECISEELEYTFKEATGMEVNITIEEK